MFGLIGMIAGIYALVVGAKRSKVLGGVAITIAIAGLVVPLAGIVSAFVGFSAVGTARVDRMYRLSEE